MSIILDRLEPHIERLLDILDRFASPLISETPCITLKKVLDDGVEVVVPVDTIFEVSDMGRTVACCRVETTTGTFAVRHNADFVKRAIIAASKGETHVVVISTNRPSV